MSILGGFYGDRVLPHLIDRACGVAALGSLRQRVCAGLTGEVVEIGFGSGLNVDFYPEAVTSVTAIEPSDVAWELAAPRIARRDIVVRRSGLDGQAVPLADNSFDSALSTWTMCSIPDLSAALSELRRVLRPGGTLHFVEHGLAPDDHVARWQRRLEPVQKRVAGGCHLTRSIPDALERAGFLVREVDTFYQEDSPKILGALSLGVALSA